jgi:hypothetical protein
MRVLWRQVHPWPQTQGLSNDVEFSATRYLGKPFHVLTGGSFERPSIDGKADATRFHQGMIDIPEQQDTRRQVVDRAGRHSRSLPHWLAKLSEWLQLGRLGQHKQQVVVAGLAGILTDYLYQIERDLKLPSHTVLFELAHLLDIPLSTLLGKAPSGNPSGRAVTAARNDLRKEPSR